MPVWDDEEEAPSSASQGITQRVREGNALPILSHMAMFDLALFGYQSFLRFYADEISYPYPNLPGIGRLANYDRYTNRRSNDDCKEFYLNSVKRYILREAATSGVDTATIEEARTKIHRLGVSAFANQLGYPRFDQPQTRPLLVLANLGFKTYLTLSPFTFLEDALRKAGKEPVTKMCRWRGPIIGPEQNLWRIDDKYSPEETRPLVYHLCGLDAHPRDNRPLPGYIALTEDDHLEMLVNLAQDRGKDQADRLPALIRGALYEDVVLLGFSLGSWAFRVLYYGVIRQTGQERDRRGICCIQLPEEERAKQEKYMQTYLDHEARFDIFWGDLHDYTHKLDYPSQQLNGE